MAKFICESSLSFLSLKHKSLLNRRFRSRSERIMPHELAVYLGVKRSQADAILIALDSGGLCSIRLLIYHGCSDAHVDSMQFGVGFPPLPWQCSECGQVIESYRDLSFDLIALTFEPIEFI